MKRLLCILVCSLFMWMNGNGQGSELPFLKKYIDQADRLSLSLNELADSIQSNIDFTLLDSINDFYSFAFDLYIGETGDIDSFVVLSPAFHIFEIQLNKTIARLLKGWIFEKEHARVRLYLYGYNKKGLNTARISTIQPPPPPPRPKMKNFDEIFKVVEHMPRFPGCENLAGSKEDKRKCSEEKLQGFIAKNIRVPQKAIDDQVEGKVVVQIIVEKNGSTTVLDITRDMGYGIAEEVKRVLELLNEKGLIWSLGPSRGRPVRILKNIVFEFRYEDF